MEPILPGAQIDRVYTYKCSGEKGDGKVIRRSHFWEEYRHKEMTDVLSDFSELTIRVIQTGYWLRHRLGILG
jgi:hypothetical protein